MKQPVSADDYYELNRRFDFWSLQLAGDNSACFYSHMTQYMHQQVLLPNRPVAELERAVDSRLDQLRFTMADGSQSEDLLDYLTGTSRKRAMMMAHKGKVVFESYPGMNPNDIHLWMSSGKTTVSVLFSMLVAEGKVSMDEMSSAYLPELKGSAWDEVPLWATAHMCTGLDIEENPTSMITPGSWITNFHKTFLGEYDVPYLEQLKEVQKLPSGERAGDPASMRYSSGTTLLLQYIVEAIEKKPFAVVVQERVWSKVGFRHPGFLCLAPDGTGVGYGMFSTTPEDMLRYAMLFTPSWSTVAEERVISEKVLGILGGTGNKQTFEGSFEQQIATEWFGEKPPVNGLQWDDAFDDGALFKHGNNGQGIYVDPKRDFCAMNFGCAANTLGPDRGPGYMRAAAKLLAFG
jgi:CubicO group peptidase (beta-lactamase class C family)